MKKFYLFMIPVMMLAACQPKEAKVPALAPSDMDLSVAPGEDFYRYANGGWMKNNPLKPEYGRFGSFDVLRERNVENLNALFAEMATMTPEAGSVDQKIVDLYKQGLDSTRLNAEGAAPLKKFIEELYAVSDKEGIASHLGKLALIGEGGFFGTGVEADLMNSAVQVLYLGQGGLGMGDRDYYVDPSNAELRKGYEAMLAKFFTLAGVDNAEQRAANAAGLEDKIAEISALKETETAKLGKISGMTSDEAVLVMERYLDSAVMAKLKQVTVIHGKGTGALRQAVQSALKHNRQVKSFRIGNFGEGEMGVTVVELR